MYKTLVIFRHEFLLTIRRVGFIILALSLPVLGLLGIGIYHAVSGAVKPPPQASNIGYVDETGLFTGFTTQDSITFIAYTSSDTALQALLKKDIASYFIIPAGFPTDAVIQRYTTQKELAAPVALIVAISDFLSSNLLHGKVPADTIKFLQKGPQVTTTTLTSTGVTAAEQGGYANFVLPAIFSFMLALAIIITSAYLVQSLSEEKESRIIEILLSSVSTRQILIGKVLGLGAAGLIQVMVWIISLPLLLNLASSSIGGIISGIRLPTGLLTLGIVYFILGYFFFAVLAAAISAITSSVREAQGLTGSYSFFVVVPFWFISLLLIAPNSPVWAVLSIFPFTAPVMVILRLGVTGVPVWQISVSITVLIFCIVGGVLLAARLFRIYTLLYGKRHSFREIVKNLREG